MVVAAAIGKRLVPVPKLQRLRDAPESEHELAFRKLDVPIELKSELMDMGFWNVDEARQGEHNGLPFQEIGVGRPLTVVLDTVYVGDYPDTTPFWPGKSSGDVLVTSAHKAFQTMEAAPRAVHYMTPNAERKISLEMHAVEMGSRLLYYTPAVTDSTVEFTIELNCDKDIDTYAGEALASAFSAAGSLPVFLPAAPYLVAASSLIRISQTALTLLSKPRVFFQETFEINFARAGRTVAKSGAFVLYDAVWSGELAEYGLGEDGLLHHNSYDTAYSGPAPYVVVSLDGTPQPEYEQWSAAAASAKLLERFYDPGPTASKAMDLAVESLTLYNDMDFRNRAAGAAARAMDPALTDADRSRWKVLAGAYAANIRNEKIKSTVPSVDHVPA